MNYVKQAFWQEYEEDIEHVAHLGSVFHVLNSLGEYFLKINMIYSTLMQMECGEFEQMTVFSCSI